MSIMRPIGGALLRPFLRSLQSACGRGRILQSALIQGRDYPCRTEPLWPHWLSTLRVAEVDIAGASKFPRQMQPDVQHVSVLNHQLEHSFETILGYPRGISTCSSEELVFISDSLHDRIIITDGSGRVLDYIGSAAGFEDGPFESARLRRPSSVVYDIDEKCLYIADCENHAIRRADLSSRVVDTVYPKRDERQGLVHRWLRKLGFMKNSSQMDVGRPQISFPWHLSIVPDGQIIAATEGFETLWMIEVGTGTVTVDSDQEPATNSKKLMESKAYQLEDSDVDWMHVYETLVKKGVTCEGFSNLVSQVAVMKSEVLVVDTDLHQLLRFDLSTGHLTTVQLTNLTLLGLPAWWSSDDDPQAASSLERLHECGPHELSTKFEVQPGRSLIGVDVALPRGTVLAEPLTEDNLWRQGRGSLVELSAFDGELLNQKITAAQQYMDDLHDLEGTIDKKLEDHSEDMPVLQQSSSGLPFYSSIDASLGTGEVIFDAVLYLKRDKSAGSDCISGSTYSGDSYCRKVTLPSSRKLSDFPDGALLMMHFSLRVKCHVYADAPQTSMMTVNVQL